MADRPAAASGGRRMAILVVAGLLALTAALAVRGASFYALGIEARVDHPDFRVLSPGSPIGHGYGVVGTALILTNLLYLIRRRLPRLRLGPMRGWLDMHVLTGLVGSVLVLFHSAFQLRSAVASLTAIALVSVVLSGLVGRYFYGLAPRADLEGLGAHLAWLDTLAPGLGAQIGGALQRLPAPEVPHRQGLFASLALVPRWRTQARERRAVVLGASARLLRDAPLDRAQRGYLRRIVREAARRSTDPVRAVAGEHLLRSWRGLHRFMALLMLLSVSVHIAVAWVFGFRWIFSE
jgi:hypothetical protein